MLTCTFTMHSLIIEVAARDSANCKSETLATRILLLHEEVQLKPSVGDQPPQAGRMDPDIGILKPYLNKVIASTFAMGPQVEASSLQSTTVAKTFR